MNPHGEIKEKKLGFINSSKLIKHMSSISKQGARTKNTTLYRDGDEAGATAIACMRERCAGGECASESL